MPVATAKAARMLTRRAIADRLRCSIASVQRLERAGWLTPKKIGKGVYFDPIDVDKIARCYVPTAKRRDAADARFAATNLRGEMAGKVFASCEAQVAAGAREISFSRVVIDTACDPALARQLVEEWMLGIEGFHARSKREASAKAEREAQAEHTRSIERAEWRRIRLLEAKQQAVEAAQLKESLLELKKAVLKKDAEA